MTVADPSRDREAVRSLLQQINDAWRRGRPEELALSGEYAGKVAG